MDHAYWGPGTPRSECGLRSRRGAAVRGTGPDKVIERTADALADGGIVGWFQGQVEFGPRALGNRSILADPRRDDMQDILNARIKHREPFRPFAPAILEERTGEWFEKSYPSPFMLLTYPCARRSATRSRRRRTSTARGVCRRCVATRTSATTT